MKLISANASYQSHHRWDCCIICFKGVLFWKAASYFRHQMSEWLYTVLTVIWCFTQSGCLWKWRCSAVDLESHFAAVNMVIWLKTHWSWTSMFFFFPFFMWRAVLPSKYSRIIDVFALQTQTFSHVGLNVPPQSLGSRQVFDFWRLQLLCEQEIAFTLKCNRVTLYQRHISPQNIFFF